MGKDKKLDGRHIWKILESFSNQDMHPYSLDVRTECDAFPNLSFMITPP